MVEYYTLREAAEKLRLDPEKLKEMWKKNQLRGFPDRGTLRFRAQEIDEMARTLGLGSDPELQLGDLPPSKPAAKTTTGGKSPPPSSGKSPPPSAGKSPPPSPGKSPPPSSRRTMHIPADADLSLVGDEHDVVPLGADPASHRGSKSPSGKSRPPSSGGKKSGGQSPSPPPAHDSDVRLVSDGGVDFQLAPDETGNVAPAKGQPASPRSPAPKKRSKPGPEENTDSGVRIVPLDQASDSDVKIVQDDRREQDANVPLGSQKAKTPSDSDVRLETTAPPSGRSAHEPFVTEEIDLDHEALKEEESKVKRRRPSKSSPELPTTSPFELSEEDATDASPKSPKAGKKPKQEKEDTDSSSDFELKPVGDADDNSPIELGSDELPIPLAKDESDEAQVVLGEVSGPGKKHDSGINLGDPRDSGISLEEGGSEEIEFGLSPDADASASATPKPGHPTPRPIAGKPDSSGEFELTMDDSPVGEEHSSSEFELTLDPGTGEEEDSSSEFELSLDPNATSDAASASDLEGDSSPVDSDSEFELSLDASGELATSDESGLAEGDRDIFETDFEVPPLDEESGSEAVALDESDTDLEDSDFELDLSDEDLAAEEGSGSQVVALEEDEDVSGEVEVDEEKPVSRKPRKKADSSGEVAEFDEPLLDLEDVEGEEEVAEEEAPAGAAAAPPAPWGVWPAVFLVPSFIVLIFVVIMSFELLNTMWGYHTGGIGGRMVVSPIAKGLGLMEKEVP
jgi:hypothetical protein